MSGLERPVENDLDGCPRLEHKIRPASQQYGRGANSTAKETPYYRSVKWPQDDDPIFSLTSVYVPRGRSNLAAYMAVNADAASPNYGDLRILRMSDTT